MREDEIIAELLRRKVISQADYARCAKEALAEGKPVVDILYEKGLVSAEQLSRFGWRVKRVRTVISGFEVIEEIKQGAMGTVYKAVQTSLSRLVALKVLPAWLARDATYVERFLREARAAAALNHPNIVSVIDVGVDSGIYYMVMEYVEGENLRDMINRRGRIPEKEALKYTLDVAQALEAAHRVGIVHRDIKPANILIASDGTAKLCDLGLAKKREGDVQLTGVGQILGSPQYMAPEQVQDSASVDIRSDIYSLGVTLFQMLTGRLPYEGRNIYEIMEKQLKEPLPDVRRIVPGISENISKLLRRMTEKRVERRYQTPTELIKDIKRVMSGRPPRSAPVPLKARPSTDTRGETYPESSRTPERRSPIVEIKSSSFPIGKIVAVAVVLVVVLIIVSQLSRSDSSPPSSPSSTKRFPPVTPTPFTPPTPPTPPSPTPPKPPVGSSGDQSVMTERQDLLPAIQEILKKYRMNREHAILALRALASRTRVDDVRKQALEVAEELCGPLVLEMKQRLEQAQTPVDYQLLLKEMKKTESYLKGTRYELEVARIKAAAFERLTTSINEIESSVRQLVREGKFDEAEKVLSRLDGVEKAVTLMRGLENLIKLKRHEMERAYAEQKRRKRENLRRSIRKGLMALDLVGVQNLLSKMEKDILPQEEVNFYLGMLRAAELVSSALSNTISRYLGKRLRFSLRNGAKIDGLLSKVLNDGLIVNGHKYKWSEIPVWQMARFVLTKKSSQQMVAACLSLMCFFKEPPDKVAAVWYQNRNLGLDLPSALREYLADAVLTFGLKPFEAMMQRRKYIEVGEGLSLLVAKFKDTRAYAAHSEKIEGMFEKCLIRSGLKAAFSGEVAFVDGMVRITYDFSDPAQFKDFVFYPQTKKEKKRPNCEWRVENGMLYGSGDGCLRWRCPTKGDIKVRLIAVPLTKTKTFYIRIFDSGKGSRGQFITVVVSLPRYKERIVGVRNGRPIKEWKYLYDEHRLGYKKLTKGKILQVGKQPSLKTGEPVIVQVIREEDMVTMKIDNFVYRAEIKGFNKGYLVLRVRKSSVEFKSLTIYCHPDPTWVRSRAR